jgi:branched-chain amino acid transport system ATP-binding protein
MAMKSGVQPLLRVDGVTVRFGGIVALDGVSFSVQSRQICGVIGPNGAGKSTLFNCLSGLYPWQSGSIEFDGHGLSGMPRHRRAALGIGRTFQNLALFGSMSVRENVLVGTYAHHHAGFMRDALGGKVTRRTEKIAAERADAVIELLSLQLVADRRVAELPFGTQKRVEMARALASEPSLLLLDEPACGLNHEELHGLGELILSLRDRLSLAVLLVEHHMGLVMGISDKVVALNFGRRIAEGTPDQVRSHPDVIKAYLGEQTEGAVNARAA